MNFGEATQSLRAVARVPEWREARCLDWRVVSMWPPVAQPLDPSPTALRHQEMFLRILRLETASLAFRVPSSVHQ